MVQGIVVGRELENLERIIQTLASLPDGESILITVLRDGQQVVLWAPSGRQLRGAVGIFSPCE